MKLLVTGSLGLVGTNIIPLLAHDFDIMALDIEEWDITDFDMGVRVLQKYKPDVVVNLAAMTDVDGCEDLPDRARELNSDGPATVAELCKANNVRFVHFSTDYVFDGEKRDPVHGERYPESRVRIWKDKTFRREERTPYSSLVDRAQSPVALWQWRE